MAPTTNTELKESASVAAASAGSAAAPPADRRMRARDALVDEDAGHHRDGACKRDGRERQPHAIGGHAGDEPDGQAREQRGDPTPR